MLLLLWPKLKDLNFIYYYIFFIVFWDNNKDSKSAINFLNHNYECLYCIDFTICDSVFLCWIKNIWVKEVRKNIFWSKFLKHILWKINLKPKVAFFVSDSKLDVDHSTFNNNIRGRRGHFLGSPFFPKYNLRNVFML